MGLFSRQQPTEVVPVQPGSMTDKMGSVTDKMLVGSNAALDKAAAIYNKNPKLIGGLAAVAGAILLSRMKRGGR